jgi:hypothetical protein
MTSRKRVSQNDRNNSEFLIKAREDNINAAVNLHFVKKSENNGRLPHQLMQQNLQFGDLECRHRS